MIPTWETIILGSVIKIENILLKEATLSKEQYEKLRLNHHDLEDFWQLEDIRKFIHDLYGFMLRNIRSRNFNAYMDAFKILSRNNYRSKELKGFLVSIDTSSTMNLDLSKPKDFTWFLMNRSGLKYQKNQPIFQSK